MQEFDPFDGILHNQFCPSVVFDDLCNTLAIKADFDNAISYEFIAHNGDICNVFIENDIAGGNSDLGSSSIGDTFSNIDLSINTDVDPIDSYNNAHQRVQPGDHQYQNDSFNMKIL